tara:strand:+ start:3236 stop:4588 length:1353 start_codon:yes stop_codon:yes gene_type:complete
MVVNQRTGNAALSGSSNAGVIGMDEIMGMAGASDPSALGQIGAGLGDIFSGLMGAGQSILSSPDALTGIAGGLLTKEAYDRLSGIGEQAKREAMGIAERGQMESEFRPFTVTTPTGAMFTARMGGQPMVRPMPVQGGRDFLPTPPIVTPIDPPSMVLPEQPTLGRPGMVTPQPIRGGRDFLPTPPMVQPIVAPGVDPRRDSQPIADAVQPPMAPTGEGLEIGMTLSPEEQALQRQLLGGAGGFFGQAMQPTVDREQTVFERIRAAQRPEEERQRLALEERLAAQGRLGTSSAAFGGATPELLAQQTAIGEARNRAMLSAMQQAQAEQAQQAALGGQFLGAGYLPQQQLIAALQPGLIQQELAQQAQQFGTGLFGETALSGIEAQLLAEQARANLLGGIGSNLITGLINQQRAAAAQPGGGTSGLGGLFGDIVGGLGNVGSGIGRLLGIGD